MKNKVFALLLALLLILCASAQAAAERFTLIMYMCGSDLQEDCVTDMQEMLKARTGDDIQIVVLAGGATSWPDKRLSANRLNLFTISGGRFSETQDWGKESMGSASTLKKYLNYALNTYPADRTMLVFWNHGGGTKSGVCFDEAFDEDCLMLSEIESVLAELGRSRDLYLDIVGFDACLMAGYEAAALLWPYAGYMVASEELEPSLGWSYTQWLSELNKNPGMKTEDICKSIISSYKKACEKADPDDYYTLSAVRLSGMPQLIERMEELSDYLADALENRQMNTISRMRQRVRSYGYWYDSSSDMIDLSSLLNICEQFAPNAASAARSALQSVVVETYKSKMVDVASGLSVYVPMDTRSEINEILEGYTIESIPNYIGFVENYAQMLNGGDYVFGASAPAALDDLATGNSLISAALSAFGFIPASGYVAEEPSGSGAPITSFIPGSMSDTQTGGAETSGDTPITSFIPGSISANQTQTGAAQGGLLGFIPGTLSAAQSAPQVGEDSMAFSLTLSQEDMDNLSYAEGALFMDISDDDGVYLVDFGYLQNTWIDWTGNTVYSLFDGTWPTLDDQFVVMYDQSRTEASRRSIIPVYVNGESTYLVVSFAGDGETGSVLGCNAGYDSNGLPIRSTKPLKDGDEIVPIFTMLYCDWEELDNDEEMQEIEFTGDPIIWHSGMKVSFQSLADEDDPTDFYFGFYLNDIFGDYELSDLIDFTM